jgi:hypothetical protein
MTVWRNHSPSVVALAATVALVSAPPAASLAGGPVPLCLD